AVLDLDVPHFRIPTQQGRQLRLQSLAVPSPRGPEFQEDDPFQLIDLGPRQLSILMVGEFACLHEGPPLGLRLTYGRLHCALRILPRTQVQRFGLWRAGSVSDRVLLRRSTRSLTLPARPARFRSLPLLPVSQPSYNDRQGKRGTGCASLCLP